MNGVPMIRVQVSPEEQHRRQHERRRDRHGRELGRLRELARSLEALCRDAPRELARVQRQIEALEKGNEP